MNLDRARSLEIPCEVTDAIDSPTFDASRRAVAEAVAFLRHGDRRTLLALAGPPGTGKSAAAAFALLGARGPSKAGRYLDSNGESQPITFEGKPTAGRWVGAGYLWHNIYEGSLWNALRRPPILVLDDLGAEFKDARASAAFESLLCERHDNARKTIVTTNLDPASFKDRYSPRVINRMHDGWRTITGGSLRGSGVMRPSVKSSGVEGNR